LPETSAITPGETDTYADGTRMDGDPDRKLTGFSVGHLSEEITLTTIAQGYG